MPETSMLIEKSFADAIAIIAAAEELPEEKRRHWTTLRNNFGTRLPRAQQ
jgi:hypothetical protein